MQYLVHMRLAAAARPTTAGEGRIVPEQFILPTLARCEELVAHKKILAVGPVSGTLAIVLIVEVGTVPEFDHLLTSLAAWPQNGDESDSADDFRRAETQAQGSETWPRVSEGPAYYLRTQLSSQSG